MKTTFLIVICLILTNITNAQVFNWGQGNTMWDVPSGSYIKDVTNQFDKFTGTWKYTNGNEILNIKITKAVHVLNTEYNVYEDFIVGDYSYSIDGGATFEVNTIAQNIGVLDSSINALYTSGPDSLTSITYLFRDVIYNKASRANLIFIPNGLQNQMHLKLINIGGGYILPDVAPSPNFCIPNNVILVKQ